MALSVCPSSSQHTAASCKAAASSQPRTIAGLCLIYFLSSSDWSPAMQIINVTWDITFICKTGLLNTAETLHKTHGRQGKYNLGKSTCSGTKKLVQKCMSLFDLPDQRPRELWYPLFDLPAMTSISHFHQTKLVIFRACAHLSCKLLKSNCISCKGCRNSYIRTPFCDKVTLPALGIWLEVTCGHRSFHPTEPEGGDSVIPGTTMPCVRARSGNP